MMGTLAETPEMKFRNATISNRNPFTADTVFKLMLEAVFVMIPMMGMSVVLYDIALNGMGSIFAMGAVALFSVWAAFRVVTFSMGLLDGWQERRILRARVRDDIA